MSETPPSKKGQVILFKREARFVPPYMLKLDAEDNIGSIDFCDDLKAQIRVVSTSGEDIGDIVLNESGEFVYIQKDGRTDVPHKLREHVPHSHRLELHHGVIFQLTPVGKAIRVQVVHHPCTDPPELHFFTVSSTPKLSLRKVRDDGLRRIQSVIKNYIKP